MVRITGQKRGGYGGVQWFNRCDVLENVLPTLGREGTMQVALVALNASSSAVTKRLLIQSNYSNPSRTEQLHLEVAVSVAVGQIMYEMTYFAEADQLNTVFGIWRKIQKVDSAFAAILADGTPDVVTDAVTALYAAGHLVGGRI